MTFSNPWSAISQWVLSPHSLSCKSRWPETSAVRALTVADQGRVNPRTKFRFGEFIINVTYELSYRFQNLIVKVNTILNMKVRIVVVQLEQSFGGT